MSTIKTNRLSNLDGSIDVGLEDLLIKPSSVESLGEYRSGVTLENRQQGLSLGDEIIVLKPYQKSYTTTGNWEEDKNYLTKYTDPWNHQSLNNRNKPNAHDSSAISFKQKGEGAIERSAQQKLEEWVSVKDWGAVGDYSTDDTIAIEEAFADLASTGKTLFFPQGVYRVTKSLRVPKGIRLQGSGKPNFNITVGTDDKRFLRPGHKHLLPGSSIIWTGEQTEVIETSRTDRFSSFGFMIATDYFEPTQMEDLGFICDVDCFDAEGNLTTYENDNRATYDVGLVVDNSMDCKFHKIAVFGYFNKKKALVSVVRNLDASNPDYNFFYDATLFGGIATIGYETSPNQGLSGTLFSGCSLYDQTYHNRSTTKADDYIDQDVIYIDGMTGTSNALNGHMFIGGCIRSTCPVPIKLNRAQGLTIQGTTTECTLNSKYVGQQLRYITGTENTNRVVIQGNRMVGWHVRLREFIGEIGGIAVIDENWDGNGYLANQGHGVSWGAPNQINRDPAIQLTDDFSSFVNGWNIRYSPTSGELQFNFNNNAAFTLDNSGNIKPKGRLKSIISGGSRITRTISNNSITLLEGSSYVALAGEGGAADELGRIEGGLVGDILILCIYSNGQPITLKNGADIRLKEDFVMTSINSTITLMKSSTGFWQEVSRSDNS